MARTRVTGSLLLGSLLGGGTIVAGTLVQWKTVTGIWRWGVVSGCLFAGSMQRNSCRGTFVRRVGIEPSCQCCVCLFIVIPP